jgi:hypothetical protein
MSARSAASRASGRIDDLRGGEDGVTPERVGDQVLLDHVDLPAAKDIRQLVEEVRRRVKVVAPMFAARLVAALAMRVSLRIEVSPDVVCWTVSGFRLRYETVRPRDQIAAVELRLHGIRLRHGGRRGGDWLAFGTRDEQRQICLLLGEALGVPVRGVRKPPSPAP